MQDFFAHETATIDDGCRIGAGTKIWHYSHIMSGCVLGERCNIGQNVVISPDVVLGNNVKVQNNVSVYTGVTCEDDVFLGPSCVFTNVTNPRSAVNRKSEYAKTHVGKGATPHDAVDGQRVPMPPSFVDTILVNTHLSVLVR